MEQASFTFTFPSAFQQMIDPKEPPDDKWDPCDPTCTWLETLQKLGLIDNWNTSYTSKHSIRQFGKKLTARNPRTSISHHFLRCLPTNASEVTLTPSWKAYKMNSTLTLHNIFQISAYPSSTRIGNNLNSRIPKTFPGSSHYLINGEVGQERKM
ncbi:hypothetical protein T265_04516 [Opisthorchis viverrini]|uniref:Uncharacterized protein n=1 Tax=Opisthorchis viverrini TaxID=6198 RepID=A0A075AGH7_OPIVI|nr:hypothetical protein T265_04516 [Opisthorchis viverrini]KER28729.1 hypothetical protein T265_04516 [Opisthorchis viverrini]